MPARYVELRAKSAFSFLHAASLPEDLVDAAAGLGYDALALADLDGLYGAPRFYKAARAAGLRAIVGSDLTTPVGPVLLLVESREGYKNLCKLITVAKGRTTKEGAREGKAIASWEDIEEYGRGLVALCRGPGADRLVQALGRRQVYVELQRHLDRGEERQNRALLELASARRLAVVATNDVRAATTQAAALQDILTCVRHKTTLAAAGRLLLGNAERHLKAPAAMQILFAERPDAILRTREVADRCAFTLEDLGYGFPDYPVPEGHSQFSLLHELTYAGARDRYRPLGPKPARQLARELDLIAKLELAGYFLIVWDVVRFCREQGILVQGRGSAANSAVCYSLGITAVDPVGMGLLFERFLSEERGEWPDIDLDLPSGDRRERVIQYVYERYNPSAGVMHPGARGAAMTANVITYRGRSAVRDVGKALGLSLEQVDKLAKLVGGFEWRDANDELRPQIERAGFTLEDRTMQLLLDGCARIQNLPRHLGQHSGGMVIARGRLDEVVPLEPASMPGRVVVQWDKEDCADLGIIKIDLLGLGMMAVLEDVVPLVRAHDGVEIDLAHLPADDPKTYDMIQRADTVGLFQIESRAQMATLPRMRPERFYDLVVEVAIIRPGPIVGQMVHPYLDRRNGRQPVTYAHPSLEPILKRTLGVPLFQEQLMRIAMVAAGFSGGEAEELRRAMGFKRSVDRMKKLEVRLREGMAERGIVGEAAEQIVKGIQSFALYGFPESHAASFALLAYASAYIRAHHPAPYLAALLNNWPMGFYHPATLVKDAQRHGVRVLPIDAATSDVACTIAEGRTAKSVGSVRLGLKYVADLRAETAQAIVAARRERPLQSIADLGARVDLRRDELARLAEIGAFACFGRTRRDALWQAEAVAARPRGLFAGIEVPDDDAAPLPAMTARERLSADYRGTGVTVGPHVVAHWRERLTALGVRRAADLADGRHGDSVKVAGVVIVRQRPGTAKGFMFLTLEDESGLANVIATPAFVDGNRTVLVSAAAVVVEGRLQMQDDVTSVKATRVVPIHDVLETPGSRDFR
jgi:error-prone DNA polymerase